jgi:tRNA/tmRNA/rRNA uracil-C5-methylase (TrmA/RlmC/RlmD family)
VADANKLKTSAGLKNMENICGDCKTELPKVCKNLKDFAIVIDPPRKGCDKEVIETISHSNPSKIIYISCNPATLARDVALLKDKYVVDFVKPFDMFPQTANVETLVVLRRK